LIEDLQFNGLGSGNRLVRDCTKSSFGCRGSVCSITHSLVE